MRSGSNIEAMLSFKFTKPFAATITATDLAERVDEFKRGLDKPVQGPDEADDGFGQRLKEACKRKANNRLAFMAKASAPQAERFGAQLKRATKERAAAHRVTLRNAPR
jgi:hypothetical protein